MDDPDDVLHAWFPRGYSYHVDESRVSPIFLVRTRPFWADRSLLQRILRVWDPIRERHTEYHEYNPQARHANHEAPPYNFPLASSDPSTHAVGPPPRQEVLDTIIIGQVRSSEQTDLLHEVPPCLLISSLTKHGAKLGANCGCMAEFGPLTGSWPYDVMV